MAASLGRAAAWRDGWSRGAGQVGVGVGVPEWRAGRVGFFLRRGRSAVRTRGLVARPAGAGGSAEQGCWGWSWAVDSYFRVEC